jgi:uncharacterized protein (TIGR02145 family)
MIRTITKISAIAILLFVFQITLTAQPVGSQIKVGTDSHISYWDGVSTWIPVAPGLPGQNLQFVSGVSSWINNPNGITTTAVTSITGTTAVSGGTILCDGGATITARGVCWSTSVNPTIALNTKTTDGAGIGSFTSNISGLLGGTTYYVRAYATNSIGTSYGDNLSFTTTGNPQFADYDGNVYDMVSIGTQVWMKQNLKTTHYKNGTAIAYPSTDNTAWSNNTSGAYAWYNNDAATYKSTYGALYNWYAVNTGNLCPTGWHVPTDAEWTTLTTYLGGEVIAGGKLKEAGLAHWNSPNTAATNETGFTALPGGGRGYGWECNYLGSNGYLWSSTLNYSTFAWCRSVYYNISYADRTTTYKWNGFSVRCLRD